MWIVGAIGLFIILSIASPASFGAGIFKAGVFFPLAYLALKGSKKINPFSSKRICFAFLPTAFLIGHVPAFLNGVLRKPINSSLPMQMVFIDLVVIPLAVSSLVIYFAREIRSDRTSLMTAAAEGQVKQAEQLLANGSLIDAQDNVGGTALHYAVLNKHLDMVSLLLKLTDSNSLFTDL